MNKYFDKYELYAVGHYLNDWPEGLSYKEILSKMLNDDDRITPCEMYEGIPLEDLAHTIEAMTASLRNYFKE